MCHHLSKSVKMASKCTCISLNIGHGDLVFGMQKDVPHRNYNNHSKTKCAQNCVNVPSNLSKSAKMASKCACISLNIGHGDLVFGMQKDVPHRSYNNHSKTKRAQNCRNVPPNLSKSAEKGQKMVNYWPYLPKYRSHWPGFLHANWYCPK